MNSSCKENLKVQPSILKNPYKCLQSAVMPPAMKVPTRKFSAASLVAADKVVILSSAGQATERYDTRAPDIVAMSRHDRSFSPSVNSRLVIKLRATSPSRVKVASVVKSFLVLL